MPYCSPEQLADLGPLLDCLRRWPRIREPRPGVFYLGDQPFCQFHSRNGQRWADVKRRKGAPAAVRSAAGRPAFGAGIPDIPAPGLQAELNCCPGNSRTAALLRG
ncbi:hypothetical protein ABZR63_25670 [Pseudomonas aeruginosa]